MGKKLLIAVAVFIMLLAGLTFAQYRFSIFGGDLQKDPKGDYVRLQQTGAKLTAARSARITFTASLTSVLFGPVANWSGTTMMAFASDSSSWQTTYDKIESPQFGAISGKLVHTPSQTVFSSPALVVPDKRKWNDLKSRAFITWPQPLADPDLGITYFPVWQDMIDSLNVQAGEDKRTHDLPDVAGAPYEYKLECYHSAGDCPLPFGTNLDLYFNVEGEIPQLHAWYGKDGLIRRLDVEGQVAWNSKLAGTDPLSPDYPNGTHTYRASFVLDDFGTPVTVTPVPADQITQSHIIPLRGH